MIIGVMMMIIFIKKLVKNSVYVIMNLMFKKLLKNPLKDLLMLHIDEPKKRLMQRCRRLERLAGGLLRHSHVALHPNCLTQLRRFPPRRP